MKLWAEAVASTLKLTELNLTRLIHPNKSYETQDAAGLNLKSAFIPTTMCLRRKSYISYILVWLWAFAQTAAPTSFSLRDDSAQSLETTALIIWGTKGRKQEV